MREFYARWKEWAISDRIGTVALIVIFCWLVGFMVVDFIKGLL